MSAANASWAAQHLPTSWCTRVALPSPGQHNYLGKPVGYKVLPYAAQRLLASPDSVVGRRGAFALFNLWATPFAPEELSAAGESPVMSDGAIGTHQL